MDSRRWGWTVVAAVAVAAAGVMVVWRVCAPAREPGKLAPRAATEAQVPRPTLVALRQPGPVQPVGAAEGTTAAPPGLTPAQWQAVRQEMAGRPDGARELQRLVDYLTFADEARRFRLARQASPGSPEAVALARSLDATLDQRLQQGEVSAPEARQMKLALLDTLETDPVERQRRLAQWQQQAAVAPAAPAARDQAFLGQQAAVVAAWQARPPAQRDPAELQRQLQALRAASFPPTTTDHSTPGGPP